MYVFLDTMIFLHCADLESIDFTEVLDCDSVTIVVPRITIRELDGHKTNNASSRIRNRARSALAKIESQAFDAEPIRRNVSMQLMSGLPKVDFTQLGLDPTWNDDQMIAAALTFATDNSTTVTVITHDTGVRLKCQQIGLSAIALPGKYHLPEELDPRDEEIRKLQRELERLENAIPRLAVYFSGTTESIGRFQLEPPTLTDESVVQSAVDDAKRKIAAVTSLSSDEEKSTPENLNQLARTPQSEIDRYESECKEYPNQIRAFEIARIEFANRLRRAIRFTFEVCNTGTAPAEDLDIEIKFPGGFQLFEEDDLPSEPSEPPLPAKPRTQMKITMDQIGLPLAQAQMMMPDFHRQVSSFSLKRTNSYHLKDHCRRIKHGDSFVLPELFLIFDSPESVTSFHCDYQLRVANLPDEVSGQVHFVVETRVENGG